MRIRSLPLGLIALTAATSTAATSVAAQSDRRQETFFDESFGVGSGGGLYVNVGDADVTVETGNVSDIRVRVIARARDMGFAREIFDDMDFRISRQGNTVRIETDERDGWNRRDWREWQDRGGAGFEVRVMIPRDFDLDMHTGDGDVAVGSVRGAVEINTGDGDIRIESVTGPSVMLHTGDGDLILTSLEANRIELRTGDGDVRIESLSGELTATTGDGDVSIAIGRFAGLSVQTGDGDVTIYADPSIAASIDVSGEDLSLGQAFTLTGRVREGRLEGTFNGGGPALRVRTGDGEVSIRTR